MTRYLVKTELADEFLEFLKICETNEILNVNDGECSHSVDEDIEDQINRVFELISCL